MRIAAIGFGALAAFVAIGTQVVKADTGDTVLLATPPGVTLQAARLGQATEAGGVGARQITKDVFADAKGMTLYTFEKDPAGKSVCDGECAKTWPPLLATAADPKMYSGWSVVARNDGAKQWAYKGKPLYTYSKDTKIGDASGNGGEEGAWRLAPYAPADGLAMPDGVAVQQLLVATGEIFVSEAAGLPLYTFDNDPKGGKPACVAECLKYWPPLVAAQLAKPVGDFTVIRRDDGVYQWALRGKPLYTFEGDVIAGDVKGDGVIGKWHVARLLNHFVPAGVTVAHNRYGGDNFATSEGKTLYIRDRVIGVNTGHSERAGLKGIPMVGRMLGAASCDAECIKTWQPVAASADALPSAYWEVITRPEGTKQWAYRGFPVYTYVGDKAPGDLKGNNIYDVMRGEDPYKMADIAIKGAGAMMWHTAVP